MKIFVGVATLLLALAAWSGPAAAAERNKCGCYKNAQGTCFCDKKAKCGCPGDCEPKGCEAAREKALQKEIDVETKRAAEADRKHTSTSKSAAGAKTGSEKASPDKGASGGEGRSGGDSTKAAPAAKKMTQAQTKQLVKLLDAYFDENPDARSRNAEEVRNQLSQSR